MDEDVRVFLQQWLDKQDRKKLFLDVLAQKEFLDGAFIHRYYDPHYKDSITVARKGDQTLLLEYERPRP